MKTVYIETSIPSYLTARASADVKSTTWQLVTKQWWLEESKKYELFIFNLLSRKLPGEILKLRSGD